MSAEPITHAIILAYNATSDGTQFDARYGGETILNRALVAMSKSGIKSVSILCNSSDKNRIEKQIGSVRHRLTLDYSIFESNNGLSHIIADIAGKWNQRFLLFNADILVHPTFLNQTVHMQSDCGLVCYKDVRINNHKIHFTETFTEKFKVVFEHPEKLRRFDFTKLKSLEFTEPIMSHTVTDELNLNYASDGVFSTDVLIVSPASLKSAGQYSEWDELVKKLHSMKILQLLFVKDAWWLRVYPGISDHHIKNFFWKIAFKDVSGEFSKIVNSKFSKPLSFFFARMGVAPNTLSAAQMILYVLASLLLFINAHWAIIAFAIIWQFSAGVLDRCDGETARIRNYESEGGAKFDVLVDDLRFGIPFIVLTFECYIESGFNFIFPVTAFLCIGGFLAIAFKELANMRKAGYQSRQFLAADIFRMMGQETASTKLAQKIRPFFKGDIRTFYISIIALFGVKTLVFWVLGGNIIFMGVMGLASIIQIKKLVHFKLTHKG
ncbi:CDP-alcohol phosphatidyltransferase family protein [bacterium]|nr:CDP-alcohol phosphatidyltransferase family protein [bacterium]